MKICKNCGFQTYDDSASVCDSCGAKLEKEEFKKPTTTYKPNGNQRSDDYYEGYRRAQSEYYNKSKRDTGGCGWMLLGIIVSPIIALVLYLVLKDDYPNRASDIGKGAIIGIVVSIVIVLFTQCAVIGLLGNGRYY